MTDNVWVPRELLEWMKEQLPNHVALDGETDLYRRTQLSRLLAQPVSNEPVAICNAYDVDWLPGWEHLKEGDKLYSHPLVPSIPEGYELMPIDSKLGHICGFTRFMDGTCMVCGNTEGSPDE